MPPITPGGQIIPEIHPEAGDLLVAYLEQLGVEYVFGVPGGAIEPLYNALARSARRGGPRPVVARHETGAAFMADGYARNTGKLGVCCATTGPGATNLITGVASAYEHHTPMLVITGQTPLPSFGCGSLQESSCTGVNIVSIFQHCTRYSTLVSHPEQLERKLATAIMTAHQSPRGPVHLSIPPDVLRSQVPTVSPTYEPSALLTKASLTDDVAVDWLFKALNDSQGSVFIVGEGCGEAIDTILQVALLLDANVVTTPNGKGLVSPYHPRYRGVIGLGGHETAVDAVSDRGTEVVVAIGTRLTESVCGGWNSQQALSGRLIHVDSEQDHLLNSPMAQLQVRGDLCTIFDRVLHGLTQGRRLRQVGRPDARGRPRPQLVISPRSEPRRYFAMYDEAKCFEPSALIKPQRLMSELARLFPPSTRFLADAGNSFLWAVHYLHPFDRRLGGRRSDLRFAPNGPNERRRRDRRAERGAVFRTCFEYAPMGWAIGASVGTALASPGNPVVCLTGDGSYLMNGQEITVAVEERLPVVFVVLNDSAYGMVKHGQRLAGAEPVAFELPRVNFAQVARAMGVNAFEIHSPSDLMALDIAGICSRDAPTLLDVYIDPEEAPPMGERLRVLGTSH